MDQLEQEGPQLVVPTYRGSESLDGVIYDLSVNFLLYVVLIIVFYMIVRFYLEEDTVHPHTYIRVATSEAEADAKDGSAVKSGEASGMIE